MNSEEKRKIKVEIRSQKILLFISFLAVVYIIYFGMENPKWKYYCAVAGAYLFTKGINYGMKWRKNKKILKLDNQSLNNETF